jgi:hypothetical protein
MRRLLVIANVPGSPILVILMMEALRFSESSALKIATCHNIPHDGILHSHRRENLKSHTQSLSAPFNHGKLLILSLCFLLLCNSCSICVLWYRGLLILTQVKSLTGLNMVLPLQQP